MKDIYFIPTRQEIQDTFTTVLEEIVHIMSTIPRLYEKFGLPAGGFRKFKDVIQSDPDTNKLQSLIDAGNNEVNIVIFVVVSRFAMDTFSSDRKQNQWLMQIKILPTLDSNILTETKLGF